MRKGSKLEQRKSTMKRAYLVTLSQPPDVTDEEMEEYIRSAVSFWKGQMSPEEPLFYLRSDKVKVRSWKTALVERKVR